MLSMGLVSALRHHGPHYDAGRLAITVTAIAETPNGASSGFRPIQYLGNKWRLLDAVESAVERVAGRGGTAVDLFAGSGVVAQRFARRRAVLAADIQRYSQVLTLAVLEPCPLTPELAAQLARDAASHEEKLTGNAGYAGLIRYEEEAFRQLAAGDPERLCRVLESGSVLRHAIEPTPDVPFAAILSNAADSVPSGADHVVSRYYGGLYFSYRQAAQLDALAAASRSLPARYRSTALAAVLSVASEVVSTVGNQFAQPVRPRDRYGVAKQSLLRTVARRRSVDVHALFQQRLRQYASLPSSKFMHAFVCDDYRAALKAAPQDTAFVYADPPYTRDHYSRFYHVLETIAAGDEPLVSSSKIGQEERLSRAMYRAERHQSPFCIRSQAPDAFESLFADVARLRVPLVLSYSPYMNGTAARQQPRLATIDDLVERARHHFARVDVEDVVSTHSKLNREQVNRQVDHHAEVLLVASPAGAYKAGKRAVQSGEVGHAARSSAAVVGTRRICLAGPLQCADRKESTSAYPALPGARIM
jgi:16S rRNA G966 N2-methylase RsmD